MNSIILIGRMVFNPELKSSKDKSYCRFSIAVNRPYKKDEADFINCVAFGKTAEVIGEYVRKGHKIALTGSLQSNKYETSSGEKRVSHEVILNSVEFLENSNNNKPEKEKNETSSDDDYPF